jgi:hypothetical protein
MTEPAGAVLEDKVIEKSISVADTPPAVDPADDDELLDELQATPPSIAIAAPTTVMRLINRPMHPLLMYGSRKNLEPSSAYGGFPFGDNRSALL